jgi:hypothetical protein
MRTIQDVTDQKYIERESQKQKKELAEQSVRVKEQFLTNMSRKPYAPMNGIIAQELRGTVFRHDQEQSVKLLKELGKT